MNIFGKGKGVQSGAAAAAAPAGDGPAVPDRSPKPPPIPPIVDEMTVQKLTTTQIYANKVYVNDSLLIDKKEPEYLLITRGTKTVVSIVEHLESLAPGEIGLNGLQRLYFNNVKKVIAKKWTPTIDNVCANLEIEVRLYNSGRVSDPVDVLKTAFLDALMNYKNHVFAINQEFAFPLANDSKAYIARIKNFAPRGQFGLFVDNTTIAVTTSDPLIRTMSDDAEAEAIPYFDFKELGIGGLDGQLDEMYRRVIRPRLLNQAYLRLWGVTPVKGMLFYGPPGTGKTLIAKKIGKVLGVDEKNIQIVNGPDILDRYVGESERRIRELFAKAESDPLRFGDRPPLHLIIFDEIDAIGASRGSNPSPASVSVLTMLLTKMDGLTSSNNVLVVAMTNREKDLDRALLRPGRFEVMLEISLPDKEGRKQIFKIHTAMIARNNKLDPDVNIDILAERTKNFTGAEIAGVVRCAVSYVFERVATAAASSETDEKKATPPTTLQQSDFLRAIAEAKPMFAITKDKRFDTDVKIDEWKEFTTFNEHLQKGITTFIASEKHHLLSICIHNVPGCGKSTIALKLIRDNLPHFANIQIIEPKDFIKFDEHQRVNTLVEKFNDAYKCPQALIILEDLEQLLEYTSVGSRFSNKVYQCLKTLINTPPPKTKLLIIATTSNYRMLRDIEDLLPIFTHNYQIPIFTDEPSIKNFLLSKKIVLSGTTTVEYIPIKHMLRLIDMCTTYGSTGELSIYKYVSASQFDSFAKEIGLKLIE